MDWFTERNSARVLTHRWLVMCAPVFVLFAASPRSADAACVKDQSNQDFFVPVPPGYGHYCAATTGFPGGATQFQWGDINSHPCEDILNTWPNGRVLRAGLWAEYGANNVLLRCDQGTWIFVDPGEAPLISADNASLGRTNCTFIVAPTYLPIFINPFQALSGHSNPDDGIGWTPSGFNYDVYGSQWDVSLFGQTPNPPNNAGTGTWAVAVDRYGREQAHSGGSAAECAPNPAGCVVYTPGGAVEPAYDWVTTAPSPKHRGLVAVAKGVVRGAQNRWTPGCCGPADPSCTAHPQQQHQAEIFIETQVGPCDYYHENFIAGYHHMTDAHEFSGVYIGATVQQGDLIATVGDTTDTSTHPCATDANCYNHLGYSLGCNTVTGRCNPENVGCAYPDHLDFSTLRTTNLTGIYSYDFQPLGNEINNSGYYGYNGQQGVIDYFGWSAPQHVDPWAWKYIGYSDPNYPNASVTGTLPNLPGLGYTPTLTDPGAFSIHLWSGGATLSQSGVMPYYQRECATNADCASPSLCGGSGWPWVCGNACQAASNRYGIIPGSWGYAPSNVQSYWTANNCETSPVAPFLYASGETYDAVETACEYTAYQYAIVAGSSWGYAPSDVQSWWTANNCWASYFDYSNDTPCQIAANQYGIIAGSSWGYAPSNVQTWWTAKQCNASSINRCQIAANQYGIIAGSSWGFAPLNVQSWWNQYCGASGVTALPWGIYGDGIYSTTSTAPTFPLGLIR